MQATTLKIYSSSAQPLLITSEITHVILSPNSLANKKVLGCKRFYNEDKEIVLVFATKFTQHKRNRSRIVPEPMLCLKCILRNLNIYNTTTEN